METNEKYIYKVYVLTDSSGRIVACEGGASMFNISDVSAWSQIDEGTGERFARCQAEYFPGGLFTEDGIPRWRLSLSGPTERTMAEIDADRASVPDTAPSTEARVAELEEALALILSGDTGEVSA